MENELNNEKALVEQSELLYKKYTDYIIDSDLKFNNSISDIKVINNQIKVLTNKQNDLLNPLKESMSKIKELFGNPINKLEEIKEILKNQAKKYITDKEIERIDLQNKLYYEAHKEEMHKRELLENRAVKAEESGNEHKAEELRLKKEEVFVPVPVVESLIPAVDGRLVRKVWKAEVTDPTLVPDEYWIIDEQKLNKLARETKGETDVPGVRFYWV